MKKKRIAYLFIAPFYILFAVFMIFPIGFSLYLSLLKWNGIIEPRYVGLQHYSAIIHDDQFLNALTNTAVFALLTVSISTALGLALALFLNQVHVMKRFYRGVYFVPAVISLVVVALVWKLILNSEFGLANAVLHAIGSFIGRITGSPPAWAHEQFRFLNNQNPWIPLLTIVFVNIWVFVGFNTVIYLAGLQGIPPHLYDVGRIDGASAFEQFRFITLPLLRPTTFFVVLMSSIDALQVFVLPNVMNPDAGSTMTVVYYVFRNAFQFYKMGYAAAVAYVLFGITILLTFSLRHIFGRDTRWADNE